MKTGPGAGEGRLTQPGLRRGPVEDGVDERGAGAPMDR